ncbi:MAG: putative 2OG-Fe(II) oxygenase [Sphingorhabdus sp.]
MASLEQQYKILQQRLSSAVSLCITDIDAATDFAIDANAGRRADLTLALLEPLADRVPGNAKIWQLLGLAWREEQVMEKAVTAFEKAATLAPQDARIALGKAQIAYDTGKPAAALFQQIRNVAPQDGELALSTAAALVQEGRIEIGEALIEELIARNPGWLRGHDWLATTRWMMGDRESFACSYAKVVDAFPADKALRMGWYRVAARSGQWTHAERIIADARAHIGDHIEFDAAEAHIATETGDHDRAERLFSKLKMLNDPSIAIAHIRHSLSIKRFDHADALTQTWLKTPAASSFWPYMSIIWRLTHNAKAGWLDGEPPFIRVFDLNINSEQLSDLTLLLRGLHRMRHHPPEQSLRGGTQTQGHLFLRLEPELQALKALILDAVREYVAWLPPFHEDHPFLGTVRKGLHFEGAWSVRLMAQGFHVVHTHPLGWISSAFYVAIPEAAGTMQAGWLQLGAPPPDLQTGLLPYCAIEPKPGRLVLFPSTMWHGTVPFDDGERLTVAFDMRVPTR